MQKWLANGYCESFNGKLRDECLNGEIFYSLKEAQIVIEQWRVKYNTRRPHSALGYRPPAPAAFAPQSAALRSPTASCEPHFALLPEVVMYTLSLALVQKLGLVSMWQGYASLAPENLRHVNPDVVFCSLILLTLPLFALGTVGISVRRWNVQKLRRPSFDRNPLNWRFDPLQSLFIAMCNGAAAGVGSLLRQATGSVAFWMKGMYLSFFFGLVIGQILVYLVYRDRVVAAH